jgi:hypothetical protein
LTVISTEVVAVPPEFVPLIVYTVRATGTVGVPVISQSLERLSPAGNGGDEEQETIVPPVLFGVKVAIGDPFV